MSISSSEGPTTAEKIRLLPWSVATNAVNTVFVQFTFFGSAFVLFLDQLGVKNSQIGLLLSLFPLFGLVALFIAPTVGRFGYRRTYLLFFGTRKAVTAFLLAVPWVLNRFGPTVTLYFIMAIVIIFALCRAISETALYPWAQEYVPDSVRGKYAATSNIYSRLTGVVAAAVGGYIISRSTGLDRFILLIAIGIVFGVVSVWTSSKRPGGAPLRGPAAEQSSFRDMLPVVQDRNFWQFLIGFGLITIVATPIESFLPLFMQNQVGLSSGVVVWLQTGTLIGGLLTTYLWGWAADRYGSKPIMLSGVYLKILLPLGWLLIPQNNVFSLPAAMTIALVQGMSEVGWLIGSSRMLYVGVVPPEKKNEYMAVYYAAIGIFGGLSQLGGGFFLDWTAGLDGQLGFLDINPFTPLFIAGLVVPIISLVIFERVRADHHFSVGEFATMFIRGHPFMALLTLPRYYSARDERAMVSVTERLGQSRSLFSVEELLDALNDPRFNVRFEAVIAIGRMPSDPRLINALKGILNGTELSLTAVAAWALGRIGDERALKSLRDGLDADYRSIQAHCARALGALGDRQIIPLLLSRLQFEDDMGLRMAYAYALGNLRSKKAVDPLLTLLSDVKNPGARREVGLSLARIVGQEPLFVSLARETRNDAGTTLSQTATQLQKRLVKNGPQDDNLVDLLQRCASAYGYNRLEDGHRLLGEVISHLLERRDTLPFQAVLTACAAELNVSPKPAEVYVILALAILSHHF